MKARGSSGMVLARSRACLVGVAHLVFVFMFGKVLKEVRRALLEAEYGWNLGYDEKHFVEARARGHTAQETAEVYEDDCVYFLRHEDSETLLAAVRFTTEEFCKAAERQGLKVNFGVAKMEALLVLRGIGRNSVKNQIQGKSKSKLLVTNSELWNNTSTCAQCARHVVQWVRRCRGEWIARG